MRVSSLKHLLLGDLLMEYVCVCQGERKQSVSAKEKKKKNEAKELDKQSAEVFFGFPLEIAPPVPSSVASLQRRFQLTG